MDKPQVVRKDWVDYTTDPDTGAVTKKRVASITLPISEDGSVGGLEEWMVEELVKATILCRDTDPPQNDALERRLLETSYAISAIITAAKEPKP